MYTYYLCYFIYLFAFSEMLSGPCVSQRFSKRKRSKEREPVRSVLENWNSFLDVEKTFAMKGFEMCLLQTPGRTYRSIL